MVIKSTIPVGYCDSLYLRYYEQGVKRLNLIFFPEFLRESKALYDNLYPSRIIAGIPAARPGCEAERINEAIRNVTDIDFLEKAATRLPHSLQEGHRQRYSDTLHGNKGGRGCETFANTYLALRVSYFNELDTYAEVKGLDSQAIIEGLGWIRELATITTTLLSDMGDTACQRIPSSCWRTMPTCRRT